ncbi:MAG TPA: Flp pilus assembly protein CpaB [bacterium]|nr:Flp pilus assembly protein CpaB [bacterium]
MNPDRKRLFFAIGAAMCAALLAWVWLTVLEQRLLHQGEEIKILAAGRYLPAYTRLKAEDLRWRKVPRAYAPTGTATDPSAVLGLQTLVPFNEDEPLIFNKLALGEQSLAASLAPGKRAVSLAVNPVSGVSGLLKPGDHVDVFLLHGQAAAAGAGLLFQDAVVLAVGGKLARENTGQSERSSTVTLALDPSDAALALAAAANGLLSLALRPSGDERPSGGPQASFSDALRRLSAAPPARTAPDASFIPHKR